MEKLAVTLKGESEFPLKDVKALADCGYDSSGNLSYVKERKIDSYFGNPKARRQAPEAQGEVLPQPFAKEKF